MARPPGSLAQCRSCHISFWYPSVFSDGDITGLRFCNSARSATRAERLAERIEAKVATASTRVPSAVARLDSVATSGTGEL
jgi:hypothetical protein